MADKYRLDGRTYGTGKRMQLSYTRAMITAALEGKLDKVDYEPHPIFDMLIPKKCFGVPSEILNPRNTWADKEAYDEKAKYIAIHFIKSFERYAGSASQEVLDAAPKI